MKKEYLEQITLLRHELHAHPELSLKEEKTKETLITFLKEHTALEIVDMGKWFYACYKSPNAKKEAIGYRADMDALPMDDLPGLSYISQNPGVAHKCGHDGHSAALAGLALEIANEGTDRDVYFIFQPAEEIGAGGEMCAQLIEDKGIKTVYAYHNMSGFPLHNICILDGVTQCASKGLTVYFKGAPAHASQPEDGKNPSVALSKLVLKVEELLKETYDGLVLATIVNVTAGSKNFGIAAYEGEVSMTLRAHYEKDMDRLEENVRTFANDLAAAEGLEVSFEENDGFPETVNDPACAQIVREAAKKNGLSYSSLDEPIRSSEDFGHFTKKCPGAIFYVGNGEDYPQVHTNGYDFNDQILETAVDMFKAIAKED